MMPSAPVAVKRQVADVFLHDAAKRVICAQMAGHEADHIFFGDAIEGSDAADRIVIATYVQQFQLDEAHLRKACRRLVRQNRRAIERVAAALIDDRTLTADAVDELIAREVP